MKKQILFCAFLICYQLIALCVLSQSSNTMSNVDPRQYVTELYRKSPTTRVLDTIWKWEKWNYLPNQKFVYLDVDGEIQIRFDKIGLIGNKDFVGTVSLEAEISGANGTRKIEVNPYSEIGEHRVPIGIKSDPPAEIAKKLIDMLLELDNATEIYKNVELKNKISDSSIIMFKDIPLDLSRNKCEFNYRLEKTKKEIANGTNQSLQNDIDKAKLLYSFEKEITPMYQSFHNYFLEIKSHSQLLEQIDSLKDYYNNVLYAGIISRFRENYKDALRYEKLEVDKVLSYMNSFENSGEDATKAFLHLLNKDIVGYTFLKNSLVRYQKKLDKIDIEPYLDKNDKIDSILLKNRDLILETSANLAELSKFDGTKLQQILLTYGGINKQSVNAMSIAKAYHEVENNADDLYSLLSREAGRMIYRKLVYGTIDLGKSGAKVGDVLTIYIDWLINSSTDSVANSPRLPIGKYYLRETGWRMEIQDMFALVQRIDQFKADSATLSPSNFKGSGGAVLMWTFFKEDRGIKSKWNSEKNKYKVHRTNRFMNFWEPSFGINVSYLDFSTKLDIEIGTGVQLGLFRNKIFFGSGVNLQLVSLKNQAPYYVYVGFSFARLFDLFKSSNNVTSAQ